MTIAPMDRSPDEFDPLPGGPPLAARPHPSLAPLLERAVVEHIRPAGLLFRQGDEPEGIVVVRTGAGEVFRTDRGRWRERIGEFGPGDVLAIASTLTVQRHLASARALVPTEILRIPRWHVRRVCRRRPELALWLRGRMEDRLDAMVRRMAWLAARTASPASVVTIERMEHSA